MSSGEVKELLAVLPSAIEQYASALVIKRLRTVEKLLPLTCRRLGPALSETFAEYAAGSTLERSEKHYGDAIGFCRYIEEIVTSEFRHAARAARFERKQLEFFHERRMFAVAAAGSLSDEEAGRPMLRLPFAAGRGLGIAIWFRLGRRHRYVRL